MIARDRLAYYVDFYGELLTEKQLQVILLHVDEDYSLSEIAEQVGSSRQAVHDLIQRTIHKLTDYEDKLGLYALLQSHEDQLERIKGLLMQMGLEDKPQYAKLLEIMDEIIY